ncbi:hypothetical protein L345_11901, partial [Ophiophagus hannah]
MRERAFSHFTDNWGGAPDLGGKMAAMNRCNCGGIPGEDARPTCGWGLWGGSLSSFCQPSGVMPPSPLEETSPNLLPVEGARPIIPGHASLRVDKPLRHSLPFFFFFKDGHWDLHYDHWQLTRVYDSPWGGAVSLDPHPLLPPSVNQSQRGSRVHLTTVLPTRDRFYDCFCFCWGGSNSLFSCVSSFQRSVGKPLAAMSLSPTMLPCKKRKTTRMDSFSEAEALPMEASPSGGINQLGNHKEIDPPLAEGEESITLYLWTGLCLSPLILHKISPFL